MITVKDKTRVVEIIYKDGITEFHVLECGEKDWSVCCSCWYFESCQFKDMNRMGIIPKLRDEIKKLKVKFFMELKNHKNQGKQF